MTYRLALFILISLLVTACAPGGQLPSLLTIPLYPEGYAQ
jgi:hypothetical protein